MLTEHQKQFIRLNSEKFPLARLAWKARYADKEEVEKFIEAEGLPVKQKNAQEEIELWGLPNVEERRRNLRPTPPPYQFNNKYFDV